MTERTVFAYFNTPEQAGKALDKLRALRLVDYEINRFNGYPGKGIQHLDRIENPITGDFPGLGYLTLGGNFSPDAAILAATSVSASGYSSGGSENRVSGRDIMLTAIVEEEDYERAYEIVRDEGAL